MRRVVVGLGVGLGIALGAVVVLAVLSRSFVQPAKPPNVLLVSIDTLRADHLSCYGYERQTSPTIDALAADGMLFEQAYSHSPKTAISHMSLLTSLVPEAHGVRQWEATGAVRLSDDIPTLATLLRQQGYATAGVTGGGHVRGELGFDQGMDSYVVSAPVEKGFARAAQWIESVVSAEDPPPFFLFLHTYQVHDPYIPGDPYRGLYTDPDYSGKIVPSFAELKKLATGGWEQRHAAYWARVDRSDPADVQHLRDLYDGGIRRVDDRLGRLLERLDAIGVRDDTLIVVLSDHGEEFLEHGEFLHEQIYQELLRVPLILVPPAGADARLRGRREQRVVRLIDVAPTILSVLGFPVPDHFQGVSLLPPPEGEATPAVEVMSSWHAGGWQALRVGDWKLVRKTRPTGVTQELYDLAQDPGERKDRALDDAAVVHSMADRLDTTTAAAESFQKSVSRGTGVAPDEATLERLRALGYLK